MAFTVFDTGDVEGRRKPVAQALGAVAIKANQFDSEPGQAGHAHDELRSGQEEFFVALAGAGHMVIDGETVELQPGRYVLVEPASQRQVIAGPEGLSYLVVGARVEAAGA
jgi:quercetin dioxygenase-like cupin family protein